jgi:hypothetical protein
MRWTKGGYDWDDVESLLVGFLSNGIVSRAPVKDVR